MSVTTLRLLDGSPGDPAHALWAVGLRYQFQHVAVRVLEIDAAAAVKMVDFTASLAVRVSIERAARIADARKGGVEFGITDEKCKMLWRRLGGIGKVKRDAVGDAHGYKPAPFRPGL